MNVIIYSANIGNYDTFKEPEIYDKNIKYILFTDSRGIKSKVWEVNNIGFVNPSLNNARKVRLLKMNPHKVLPSHDISIWIDHAFNHKINNVNYFLDFIGFKNNVNLMCFKHPWRSCIYDEADVVIKDMLDKKDVVKNLIKRYKSEGYPRGYGLNENGVLVRRNNVITNNFNELWWDEIIKNSQRDQLSQMYVAWKLKFKIHQINIDNGIRDNRFLGERSKHLGSRIVK